MGWSIPLRIVPIRPSRLASAAWRRRGAGIEAGATKAVDDAADERSRVSASRCWSVHMAAITSGSAQLLDADEIAGRIAERAVANAVGLLGRLLDDLGIAGLQPVEGVVEILGSQEDPAVGALGHHLGDRAALVVGDTGVDGRRRQEDGGVGLVGGADGDPAHRAGSDVGADLEAKGVAPEGEGGVRVVVREGARVNGDVHGGHATCAWVTSASRFLIGLVTCCATHDAIRQRGAGCGRSFAFARGSATMLSQIRATGR